MILILVLCSVRLELVHKNTGCKSDTNTKGSHTECLHTCMCTFIYMYFLK